MSRAFPDSPHVECANCGVSLTLATIETHVCDSERLLDFRLLQLRDEIALFEPQFTAWLGSTRGRFATWIAERDRRAGPDGPPAFEAPA